jgi:NDP-sugar pyrophosphorylase family protein
VTWVDEGEDLRGTAGALRLAHEQGALAEHFHVLYGDSYLPAEMSVVEDAWRASGMPALMTVLRNEGRWDTSNVIYGGGRVTLYDKRGVTGRRREMRWIDYGLSIISRDVVAARVERAARADLSDVMHELSLAGQLAGLEVSERFYEVGSPEGLRDLEAYLAKQPTTLST